MIRICLPPEWVCGIENGSAQAADAVVPEAVLLEEDDDTGVVMVLYRANGGTDEKRGGRPI